MEDRAMPCLYVYRDQMKKSVEKFAGGKHKKVEQALGLSLRNLFEQLA